MPLYTDRDYLDSKFQHSDRLVEEAREDIKALRKEVHDELKGINDAITGNRVELAKAGGLSAFLIMVTELFKRQLGQ